MENNEVYKVPLKKQKNNKKRKEINFYENFSKERGLELQKY